MCGVRREGGDERARTTKAAGEKEEWGARNPWGSRGETLEGPRGWLASPKTKTAIRPIFKFQQKSVSEARVGISQGDGGASGQQTGHIRKCRLELRHL